jgi:hypothetical protein
MAKRVKRSYKAAPPDSVPAATGRTRASVTSKPEIGYLKWGALVRAPRVEHARRLRGAQSP